MSARIRILPDQLIDVIAAGEVVERPASVVKELVENALDAGARSIEVHLADGGRRSIVVADDGAGMDEDDCLMAIERHATSKIGSLEDLRHLRTLGFRGEALPSIASVGRFILESWDGKAPSGTRVIVDNGKLVSVEPAGRARGTTVTLEGLFRKLPARRKFLRSAETEKAWCLSVVEDAGLANPSVAFTVTGEGVDLLRMPPAATLLERAASLWGAETASRLLALAGQGQGVSLEGFISPPTETYARRSRHRTIVNGRPVRDPLLNRAISSALSGSWPAGRFPALILALQVPDDLVDVNVHPAKREVRFRRVDDIAGVLRGAVRVLKDPVRVSAPYSPRKQDGEAAAREGTLPFPGTGPREGGPLPSPRLPGEGMAPSAGWSERRVLGQVRGTYILVDSENGLELVDQHAAHERIVFNRLLTARSGRGVPVQRLAVPLVFTLSPSEGANLAAARDVLCSFGFEIEDFGPATVRITAAPADLKGAVLEDLLRQLTGDAELSHREPEEVALAVSRWACRESVMAGRHLSPAQAEALLRDLESAESGFSCPHGRPTRVTLSLEDLEKLFGRR